MKWNDSTAQRLSPETGAWDQQEGHTSWCCPLPFPGGGDSLWGKGREKDGGHRGDRRRGRKSREVMSAAPTCKPSLIFNPNVYLCKWAQRSRVGGTLRLFGQNSAFIHMKSLSCLLWGWACLTSPSLREERLGSGFQGEFWVLPLGVWRRGPSLADATLPGPGWPRNRSLQMGEPGEPMQDLEPSMSNLPVTFTSSVQLLSRVRLFATPWTAARQASLSITNSWSLCKLMSIESVMPSNHLILCCPLLLPLSSFPSIRVFYNNISPWIWLEEEWVPHGLWKTNLLTSDQACSWEIPHFPPGPGQDNPSKVRTPLLVGIPHRNSSLFSGDSLPGSARPQILLCESHSDGVDLVVSCVWLFVTPSSAACQASLAMEFSRQEYWSGLLFPTPGEEEISGPEIEPESPELQVDSLPLNHLGNSNLTLVQVYILIILENKKFCMVPTKAMDNFYFSSEPWRKEKSAFNQASLMGYSPWGCRRVRIQRLNNNNRA